MQDAQEEARRLIHSYFVQFTVGCDRIVCNNRYCKSCADFAERIGDANDAAVLAIDFTLEHPMRPRLCSGLNPIMVKPVLRANLQAFDTVMKDLIKNKPVESAIAEITLYEVFSSEVLFPFVMMTNDQKMTCHNLALDDECLADFVRAMHKNVSLFQQSMRPFEEMVQKLIKDPANDALYHIRAMILVLACDIFVTTENFFTLIVPVLKHINRLPRNSSLRFFKAMRKFPKNLELMLAMIQNSLTIHLIQTQRHDLSQYFEIARFLLSLRDISSLPSEHPLGANAFTNDSFTELAARIRTGPPGAFPDNLENLESLLRDFSVLLNLNFKNDIFQQRAEVVKQSATQQAIHQELRNLGPLQLHVLMNLRNREDLYRNIKFSITVRRDHILDDTIQQVSNAPPDKLARKLMVTFAGEDGVDAGGVTREYFNLLIEKLFSPEYGMFRLIDKYYWFNPANLEAPILFRTLGVIVSLAVYNNTILPIRFPLLLYKKLLEKKITLTDIAELEPTVVKSIKSLIEMKENGQDVADTMLTFTASIERFGEVVSVPIKPGGESIDVTNDNIHEYARAYVSWFANDSIGPQFRAFADGFHRLLKPDDIKLLTPDELDTLVSGEEVLEWDELEKNAKYEEYRPNSRAVKWFWEIFRSFSNDEKKKFLFFTTGSDHAPVGGLSKVCITIQKGHDTTKLPVAHTCFSVFCLPDYPQKTKMRHNILLAISYTEGFGLK